MKHSKLDDDRKHQNYTSIDYIPTEPEVWRHHENGRRTKYQNSWWTLAKQRSSKRWFLIGISGVVVALAGVCTILGTRVLIEYKFQVVQKFQNDGQDGLAFLAYWGFNLFFSGIAGLFVVMEPLASGSGIPEVKCFLNGIDMPRVVRIKTIFAKIAGVTFAVAGQMPCGKEGPMIHSGAGIAAGMSQGKSSSLKFDVSYKGFEDFRNDKEKRDMVACGAAAGVCVAFQSALGGVLFALEEGTSHWSSALTWRTFFCVTAALFTLYMANASFVGTNMFLKVKMMDLGSFKTEFFPMWEYLLFMVLGVIGGALGAGFNNVNKHITKLRKKFYGQTGTVSQKFRSSARFAEVWIVCSFVTFFSYGFPYMLDTCKPLPTNLTDAETQSIVASLVRFNCPQGEYNELASLFMNEQESAMRLLFHYSTSAEMATDCNNATVIVPNDSSKFNFSTLFIFWFFFWAIAVVTYGLGIPSGLFVPALLSGATWGRILGQLFALGPLGDNFSGPGQWAFIGAVAHLGGVARMTISITAIVVECIQNLGHILPVMVTLLVARFIGNAFNDGLYDIQIHLNKLPLLEPNCPQLARQKDMSVREVMSKTVHQLQTVMTAGDIYDLVSREIHHNFPVINAQGRLQGWISRHKLAVLFLRKAFGPAQENFTGPPDMFLDVDTKLYSPLVMWDDLSKLYPRYPSFKAQEPNEAERHMLVDLRPYIDTSPFVLHESASVRKAYNLFRSMGMRTLFIIDHEYCCVGIVTRHDLQKSHISERLRTRLLTPASVGLRNRANARRIRASMSSDGRYQYVFGAFGQDINVRTDAFGNIMGRDENEFDDDGGE